MSTWNLLRDETQQLKDFERICFALIRKVFFVTTQFFVTCDVYLFGTRATNNQFKTSSNQKEEREGHTADLLADPIFRIVVALHFSCRGDKDRRIY